MHITIGSHNPVKIQAAQAVLCSLFPNAQFSSAEVPSGVRPQPWGEDETRQGALNRAQAVLAQTSADLGIGLEGGIIETPQGMMTTAWCVILSRAGQMGIGGGINILLPSSVAESVRKGAELGTAMDQLIGQHNTKQGQGAIGILTRGALNRQQAYQVIIELAAAPFRSPDYYEVRS